MYLCYIDESGTSAVPGNTSHFVLAGISVPISRWKEADASVSAILSKYELAECEFHTAWLLRAYREQSLIQGFAQLDWNSRRSAVQRHRTAELLRLQKARDPGAYRATKKAYSHTRPYIHLARDERIRVVSEVAECVSGWRYARLFAECIDKIHFDPMRARKSVDEQAFEQVVSRFEQFLSNTDAKLKQSNFGLLVHDNNQTVAARHTDLMRRFHEHGTLWTRISKIIETPLFVDSRLTRLVQIADLCAYALRRYVENRETDLFDRVYARVDRARGVAVGIRHFSSRECNCKICVAHGPPPMSATAKNSKPAPTT
jgi:Protein of unknown function (DUF3800)